MKTVETFVLLGIFSFISKTMSTPMSWSSQVHNMIRTKTSKRLAELTSSEKMIIFIQNGTQLAVEQCRETFKFDIWNCPKTAFSTRYKHPFSKEIAYTQAITAAGVVYAITKGCSEGKISGCGCDSKLNGVANVTFENVMAVKWPLKRQKKTTWIWSGCSDNTEFAEKVAKNILDTLESGNDAQAYCTRENNRLGRKIVRETMQKKCKCNGVFGSCNVQTCAMKLAPFEDVAKALKKLYFQSAQINFEHARYGLSMGNSGRVSTEELKKVRHNALLYVEQSPDYCRVNPSISWPGTKGRLCSKVSNSTDPSEKNSCKKICQACGYKARREIIPVRNDCNCSFHFCCEVRCETCIEMVDSYHCV